MVIIKLQQYLPFTVLKLSSKIPFKLSQYQVTTVLTVYGIETTQSAPNWASILSVETVLTVYGIEIRW